MSNSGQAAIVSDLRAMTPEIVAFSLKTDKPVRWAAGQYVTLSFGARPPRPYSIASAPDSGVMEIHVKRMGGASAYAVESLREEDEVIISAPQGSSFFDPVSMRGGAVLMIAGGMGITPMKAIAETALPHNFDVLLYWGVKEESDLYLQSHFEVLVRQYPRFRFRVDIGSRIGNIAPTDFSDCAGHEIFLAGPPPMIDATLPLLLDRGARMESIHYDRV